MTPEQHENPWSSVREEWRLTQESILHRVQLMRNEQDLTHEEWMNKLEQSHRRQLRGIQALLGVVLLGLVLLFFL